MSSLLFFFSHGAFLSNVTLARQKKGLLARSLVWFGRGGRRGDPISGARRAHRPFSLATMAKAPLYVLQPYLYWLSTGGFGNRWSKKEGVGFAMWPSLCVTLVQNCHFDPSKRRGLCGDTLNRACFSPLSTKPQWCFWSPYSLSKFGIK